MVKNLIIESFGRTKPWEHKTVRSQTNKHIAFIYREGHPILLLLPLPSALFFLFSRMWFYFFFHQPAYNEISQHSHGKTRKAVSEPHSRLWESTHRKVF